MDEEITIRRLTASDKEDVLALRENTEPGPDSLPAYFDYYSSIPNAYPAGIFYKEKLAGFLVGHIVDNGMTGVIRSGRAAPEYEGRGLMRILFRHVAKWAGYSGVESIVSLSDEVPANTDSKRPKRFDKTVLTWRWVQLTVSPRKLDLRHENDDSDGLESVSDEILSVLFNDQKTRDYIAPKGIMLLHWTPLKPLEDNIPTIRGLGGSTTIYSDINVVRGWCTGLLSCCTKYRAASESKMDYKFCVDIFGTDSSSLRKHMVKHFEDLRRSTENRTGLKIVLSDGKDWSEVIQIFTEGGVVMAKEAEFLNVHLHEWWRSPDSAAAKSRI